MSIPVHFNGSLLNIMGGGAAAPPPPTNPITLITADIPDEGDNSLISQLYYGTGGATTGFQATKATFLAQNPGLTLQDFTGIAPANQRVNNSGVFTGFTITSGSGSPSPRVADTGFWTTTFPFQASVYCTMQDGTLHINFSPSVTAVGFNIAQSTSGVTCTYKVFSGVTLLTTQTFVPARLDVFTTFAGYVSS